MRDLCKKHPKGVEIVEPNIFHKDLATCIGMRLQPSNIEDLILGYVSAEYRHHYRLLKTLEEGVNVAMRKLKYVAQRFESKHRMMPCIYIDGVDLLAAKNEEAFLRLISYAKEFANDRLLHIVVVSLGF